MSTVQFVAPGRPVAQQAGGGGGGGGRGRCGRGLGGRRQQDSTRACDQVLRDSQIWHVGTLTPYNGTAEHIRRFCSVGLLVMFPLQFCPPSQIAPVAATP